MATIRVRQQQHNDQEVLYETPTGLYVAGGEAEGVFVRWQPRCVLTFTATAVRPELLGWPLLSCHHVHHKLLCVGAPAAAAAPTNMPPPAT